MLWTVRCEIWGMLSRSINGAAYCVEVQGLTGSLLTVPCGIHACWFATWLACTNSQLMPYLLACEHGRPP